MQKSADAFRTISEVADDLTLPQHVLRFWETRFPQIRPLKRAGGRRYYRPADVVLLKTIRQLLYDDGYTIKGVQRLLKEQGPKGLAAATHADLTSLTEDDTSERNQIPTAANDSGPADFVEADWDPAEPHQADFPAAASNPSPTFPDSTRRADLIEAIDTIDECMRILAAVRRTS